MQIILNLAPKIVVYILVLFEWKLAWSLLTIRNNLKILHYCNKSLMSGVPDLNVDYMTDTTTPGRLITTLTEKNHMKNDTVWGRSIH